MGCPLTEDARTVHGSIGRRAQQDPAGLALLAPGRPPLAFQGLLEQIEYVVANLNAIGVSRGDAVALLMPSGPDMAAALLAIAAGAGVAQTYGMTEAAPLITSARSVQAGVARPVCKTIEELAPLLREACSPIEESALARIRASGPLV